MPILQINFKLNVPADAYVANCKNVVNAFSDVAGLRWKIWIMNEKANEAGGLYCFDTDDALNRYLSGPIVAGLKQNPAFSDLSVKQFDVLEELTQATRGPVSG